MIVYSPSIQIFQKNLLQLARGILSYECRFEVGPKKFTVGHYRYPLNFLIFEHPKLAGEFNPCTLDIMINRNFMFASNPLENSDLLNTVRHELAHYLSWIFYGDSISAHGPQYQEVCRSYGWGKGVSGAHFCSSVFSSSPRKKFLVDKVEKLLNLAHKAHGPEALAALSKAQQLIQKYELESLVGSGGQEGDLEELVVGRLLVCPRANQKMSSIATVLSHFMVIPYFSRCPEGSCLEVVGKRDHVEVAQYVAIYLDREFERLWMAERGLSGIRQKNSFFRGLEQGLMKQLKKDSPSPKSETGKELLAIKEDLRKKVYQFIPRLRSQKSSFSNDPQALGQGVKEGQNLQIRQGLKGHGEAPLGLSP